MAAAQAQMSSATVFLFLLDNLPDLKSALNSTLVDLSRTADMALDASNIEDCNPVVARYVLNEIKNNMEHENLSRQASEENAIVNDFKGNYNELSQDITHHNIERMFEEKTETDDNVGSTIKPDNTINETTVSSNKNKLTENEITIEKFNATNIANNTVSRNATVRSDIKFPKKAPFLVAMFETLSNVTAQTCGGTLVSRQWVLTAVSCLGWLSNMYVDRIQKDKSNASVYTIIVGATNPFKDGSVHRVIEMVFVPEVNDTMKHTNVSTLRTWNKTEPLRATNRNLGVVLMRIDPAASVETLPISRSNLNGNEDVRVYGWLLVSNETGNEVMEVASFPAKTLPAEQCEVRFPYLEAGSVLCLTVQSDPDSKINQMYYGGPVLVRHKETVRLLAVAQSERAEPRAALYAYPLAAHTAWLDAVVGNKQ